MTDYTIDPARTRAALHDLTAIATSGGRVLRNVRQTIDTALSSLAQFDERHGETMDALRAHVDHLAGEVPEPLRVATSPDVYGTERGTPVVTARGVKVGEVEGVTDEGRAVLRIDDPDVAAAIRADHGSFKVREVETITTVDTVPVTAQLKVYPGERRGRSSLEAMGARMSACGRLGMVMFPSPIVRAAAQASIDRAEAAAREFDSAMDRVARATRDMRRGPVMRMTGRTEDGALRFTPVDEAPTRTPRAGSAEDPTCFTSRSADDLPDFEPGIARAKAAAENPPEGFTLCPDCRGAGVHFPCSTCEGSALVPEVDDVEVWCGATVDVTIGYPPTTGSSVRVVCGHLDGHGGDHRGPIEPGRPGDVTWPNVETPGVEFMGDPAAWTDEERAAFAVKAADDDLVDPRRLHGQQFVEDLQLVLPLAEGHLFAVSDDRVGLALDRLANLVGITRPQHVAP